MSKGFDLSSLQVADSTEMVIKHPVSGEDLDIKFVIAGRDSKVFRRAQRVFINKRSEAQEKENELSKEEKEDRIDQDTLIFVASVVVGWEGVLWQDNPEDETEKPYPLEFSADNVVMVFERLPWLKEQVSAFAMKRANFMKR